MLRAFFILRFNLFLNYKVQNMKKNVLLIVLMATFSGMFAQPLDTISFENPSANIHILQSTGNLWQIGKPQKTFFNGAHSGSKVIVTDTSHYYPAGDTSSFDYVIHTPITQSCQTCLQFWHKYEMDSTGDQGLINVSYDGGNSWIPLKDTTLNTPYYSIFTWNGDYHAANSTTTQHNAVKGKSDGWIQSRFCWQWWIPIGAKTDSIIVNPDSMMVRFTFISDGTTKQKEGWMIDDFKSYNNWGGCSGIEEYSTSDFMRAWPIPFTDQTVLNTRREINDATLGLYNSLGQEIMKREHLNGKRTTLGRNGLPAGLYTLKLSESGKVMSLLKIMITD